MVGAFLDTTPKPPIINNSVFRSLPGATPTETKAQIQSLNPLILDLLPSANGKDTINPIKQKPYKVRFAWVCLRDIFYSHKPHFIRFLVSLKHLHYKAIDGTKTRLNFWAFEKRRRRVGVSVIFYEREKSGNKAKYLLDRAIVKLCLEYEIMFYK